MSAKGFYQGKKKGKSGGKGEGRSEAGAEGLIVQQNRVRAAHATA